MGTVSSDRSQRPESVTRASTQLEKVAPPVIALVIAALPLVFPLGIARDYPNHLARVFIEHRLGNDPLLARNYALEWFVVPDLAMDLFALPLAGWLSPYAVGALFNAVTVLLVFTAALALARRGNGDACGIWPLLATTVLFNEAFRWGFMNFLFACGMALWIVHFWLGSDHWPRRRRIAVFSALQLLLFFAHALGFLLCGYMLLTLEAVRLWRSGDQPWHRRCATFAANMLQFLVPLAILGYVLMAQSGVGDSTSHYGGLGARLAALISPISGLSAPGTVFVAVGLVVLLYIVWREGIAVIDRRLLPIVASVGLLVIAMPYMFLGIWGLHFRYPFVALLLLIAAVRPNPRHPAISVVWALVMLLVIVSIVDAASGMYERNRRLQEVREAFVLTEPGGAILSAGQYDPACLPCGVVQIDEIYASALAAIERRMFVPNLFTATSLVAASPLRHDLDVPRGWPVTRQQLVNDRDRPLPARGPMLDLRHPYWYSWDRHFDYLLWLRYGDESLDDVDGLQRLASGESFILYRIQKR